MPTLNGTSGSDEPRRWDRLHVWQIQAVRDLLMIAALIGLVYLGYAMRTVTTPLLIALALAYLFEPFVGWSTERLQVRRPFVVGGLLAMLVTVAGATLLLTVPLAVRQSFSLMDDVRSGRLVRAVVNAEQGLPDSMREPFRGFLEVSGLLDAKERLDSASGSAEPALDDKDDGVVTDAAQREQGDGSVKPDPAPDVAPDGETTDQEPAGAVETLPSEAEAEAERVRLDDLDRADGQALFSKFFDSEPTDERIRRIVREELAVTGSTSASTGSARILGFLHRGVSTAWSVLGTTIAIGLLLFLIPFYFFFFSLWWPTVTGFLSGLIPQLHRPRAHELLGQMDRAVAGFVRGRVVISAIVAVILAIGWYSIGVPYSIVLALVVGVFNLVPYLCGIGLPVAIGLLAMDQLGVAPEARMTWVWIALAPTIVFVVAQFLDGYVLTPLIAGKATDLDPVTIVVAIIAGGTIAGVYGMLIAIPAAACVKILLREVLLPKVKAWTRGEAADPLPIQE